MEFIMADCGSSPSTFYASFIYTIYIHSNLYQSSFLPSLVFPLESCFFLTLPISASHSPFATIANFGRSDLISIRAMYDMLGLSIILDNFTINSILAYTLAMKCLLSGWCAGIHSGTQAVEEQWTLSSTFKLSYQLLNQLVYQTISSLLNQTLHSWILSSII